MSDQLAYSIKDFGAAYGLGRSSVYRIIAEGQLRVVKAGRRTIILKVDADAWAAALPVGVDAGVCGRGAK
jgi:hypothetical protein